MASFAVKPGTRKLKHFRQYVNTTKNIGSILKYLKSYRFASSADCVMKKPTELAGILDM